MVGVQPDIWKDVFAEVFDVLRELGYDVIGIGAVAFSANFFEDTTKDVDVALGEPIEFGEMKRVGSAVERRLKSAGLPARFERVQLGRSPEDWVTQVFVFPMPGRVLAVEVFNLIVARPASLFDSVTVSKWGIESLKVLDPESWFTSKIGDPNGVDSVNLKRLEFASKYIDMWKVIEVLRRTSLLAVAKENAEDVAQRSPRLSSFLKPLLE
jgi:hypothetical protein